MASISKKYAAYAVLAALICYSVAANYKTFVEQPRQEERLGKERSAKEKELDPLFSDVRHEKDGTVVRGAGAKLAAEQQTAELLKSPRGDLAAQAVASATVQSSYKQPILLPNAEGTLRIEVTDQAISFVEIELGSFPRRELTEEEMVSGSANANLRRIQFEHRLTEPLSLAIEPGVFEPKQQALTGKGRAYVDAEAGSERLAVDVELVLTQSSPINVSARFFIALGERPERGQVADRDKDRAVRIYLTGTTELTLPEMVKPSPTPTPKQQGKKKRR